MLKELLKKRIKNKKFINFVYILSCFVFLFTIAFFSIGYFLDAIYEFEFNYDIHFSEFDGILKDVYELGCIGTSCFLLSFFCISLFNSSVRDVIEENKKEKEAVKECEENAYSKSKCKWRRKDNKC